MMCSSNDFNRPGCEKDFERLLDSVSRNLVTSIILNACVAMKIIAV